MNNPSMVIVLLGCLSTNNARILNFGLKESGEMKDNSAVSIASSSDSGSNHTHSFSKEKKGVEFNVDRLQGLLYEENKPTVLSRIIPLDLIEVKKKGSDSDMFGVSKADFFRMRLLNSSRQVRETTPLIRMKREIDFTDPVVQELLRFYMKHQKGKGRYGSRWG